MKLKYIEHACFRLILNDKVIYFDPYKIPKDSEKADIVLASHDHYDHLDKQALKSIAKDSTIMVLPKTCSLDFKNIKKLSVGEMIEIEKLNISAVAAYNPNKRFHPKSNQWLGYIVSDKKINIYHAGDTDLIPEMKDLKNIDIALIPVGDTYTMGFNEAADALNTFNPKNAIPMHHWGKNLNEFKKICERKGVQSNIIILKEGE